MKTVKTDKSAFEKLHNEWLTNLYALEEELLHIDSVTKQLRNTVNDLHYQQHLSELRKSILMQTGMLRSLTDEILEWRETFIKREDKKLITLQELIQNNALRDKVRKTEQAVFLLKYQVSKLLSLAS